jgi:uncharacterized protein YvpB
MKKAIIVLSLLIIMVFAVYGIFEIFIAVDNFKENAPPITEMQVLPSVVRNGTTPVSLEEDTSERLGKYRLYTDGRLLASYDSLEIAMESAVRLVDSIIMEYENGVSREVYSNFRRFSVYIGTDAYGFDNFLEAVRFAEINGPGFEIYHRRDNSLVYTDAEIPKAARMDIDLILQFPELPRGCEVTSLAMMLIHLGYDADKIVLAAEVHKDDTPRQVINGVIHYGNPNRGFIGDMYDRSNDGYAVYHAPIYDLLKQYVPNSAIDLTGCSTNVMYYFLSRNRPIWIVTNTTYNTLRQNQFERWVTPDGDIYITWFMHSILVTGYDENYIYFNDPYGRREYAPKRQFWDAWIQMGRQAVAVTP